MSPLIRYTLVGLGNIGRNLLDVLVHRETQIEATYGLSFRLVGAADSSGVAMNPNGLDILRVRDRKLAGRGVATYPGRGRPGMTAQAMIEELDADLLVEVSPTNLQHGQPGLGCILTALGNRQHVVTANKGPLVLAYQRLTAMARDAGVGPDAVKLLYSGTVAGGLPTVNIGVRDLAGSAVTKVEGIFNGTTNYILTRMDLEGMSYDEALKGAQAAGIAEADPTLDVDGWDAANKLVIIANSVLRRPTVLSDVQVEGIRGLTQSDLQRARQEGKVIKLLALAIQEGDDYALSVRPTALDKDHPMARTGLWDMGVVYHTDYMGVISAVIEEKGPVPTSAAVLRDMINIYAR
jgi:homoserine dehydrogenase